jgi:hypothetical protein
MARRNQEPPDEDGQAYQPGEPLSPEEQAMWRDRIRNGHAMFMPDHKLKWWEDGDKQGALFASIVLLCIGFILLAICIRVAWWILP